MSGPAILFIGALCLSAIAFPRLETPSVCVGAFALLVILGGAVPMFRKEARGLKRTPEQRQ